MTEQAKKYYKKTIEHSNVKKINKFTNKQGPPLFAMTCNVLLDAAL